MNYNDNSKYGYIKLFRSFKSWEWFKEPLTAHLFIYCLLSANNKDKQYKGTLIKRGSFVTSYELLSTETGLSIQNIRTSLKRLKATNELTIKSSKKGTIISINNYDIYQSPTNTLTTNQQNTNKQSTTNKNCKNINDVVGGGNKAATPTTINDIDNPDFIKFWNSYGKKGFLNDTLDYWNTQNYDYETINNIINGAVSYTNKMENDIDHMVFPRTFLQNEMWKNYKSHDSSIEEALKTQKRQIEYLRSKGVEIP
ncbi:MAG: hypothetical protein LUG60_02235 [Erysipelotrichaceae bacterium]|nr:hypothetical protein [Erysipelotrichaceae bacterium]